jgi:S1-C subfamily serine protease
MVVSSFSFRRWLGCAIPADRVRKGLDRIAGKEPAPGAGEGAFDVASIGAALEEKDEAWTVRSVTPGGVADRLGWKPGDRIVRVGREAPAGGEGGARKAFRPGAKVAVVLDKANWRVGFEFQVPEGAGAKKGDDSEF